MRLLAGNALFSLLIAAPQVLAQEPAPPQPSPGATPAAASAGIAGPVTDAPLAVIRMSRLRGVSTRVAALMVSGQSGGPIPISALAVPVAVAADTTTVLFVADIEGTNFLAGQEMPVVQAEVVVYAVTAQGSVVGALAQAFTLDLDRAVALLSRGGIKLVGTLNVPPGACSLRVLVRNVQVGSFGITQVPHVTPPGEGTFAFLSPLLSGEPAGAWVLAREPGEEEVTGALGHPFAFLPKGSLPATRPVLATGSEPILWVLARGAAPGAATLPVRVVGREGKEVARLEATVLERRESGLAGATVMRLRLPVPALEPGPYIFELSALAMNPDVQLASSTQVVVGDRTTVQAHPVWVLFGTPRQPEDEETRRRTAFAGRARHSKASAKLAAEYRSALEKTGAQPLTAVHQRYSVG